MIKYKISGQLAYLNDHDGANRANKFVGANLKKKMTELVAWQVKGKPPVTKPCTITFHWFISSKHDPDNIRFAAKYVLDGMIKGGVLPNDNQKWILGFRGDYFTRVEPGNEGVEVVVEYS
jgi:hypothetical protein